MTFNVTKLVSSRDLPVLIELLNAKTRDAHVAHEVKINPTLWLVRIECGHPDDAEFVRRHL